MGSYYKRQKRAAAARQVTRAPWLYHATLPDLLPAIREQGLRPLRDVASRLARDFAEKMAADAGMEPDPTFVHLHAADDLLRLILLTREVALLRLRPTGVDPALLTRDPKPVLEMLRSEETPRTFARAEVRDRLRIPGDTMLDIQRRLEGRDLGGALDLFAPFADAAAERVWEGVPLSGSYRYAGTIPPGGLQVLLEFPEELKTVHSIRRAMETPLRLDVRRWGPLTTADLSAAARGLGRTEFPGDAAL